MLRRTIYPHTKVLDASAGLVEYVASDETLDHGREIIRASGWRFRHFDKNAPFVDSHDYGSIERVLGRVVDREVRGRRLIEVVKWAVDVADNRLAQLGFRMTSAGYLKAVSVGFQPVKQTSRWDRDQRPHEEACRELGQDPREVSAVYLEQEQLELSACVIGMNPNALARAYKAAVLSEADLRTIAAERTQAPGAGRCQGRAEFLAALERLVPQVAERGLVGVGSGGCGRW
ncbi:MAG TPA: hypothetical protein PKI20_19935 [Verrucomicrobiota bacterium]|nr:hypothetical protein [Verrucomicrobiota bacterium]HQL80049.1 hypothetical protein [Verrucomicrobiota bacterium]